jgi:hypothetical protein
MLWLAVLHVLHVLLLCYMNLCKQLLLCKTRNNVLACGCYLQDSSSSLQYAAFFVDCEHELTPLTRGMRLVLTYNLVYTGPAANAPRLSGSSPAEMLLQRALRRWERSLTAGDTQTRIAFLLGECVAGDCGACCMLSDTVAGHMAELLGVALLLWLSLPVNHTLPLLLLLLLLQSTNTRRPTCASSTSRAQTRPWRARWQPAQA